MSPDVDLTVPLPGRHALRDWLLSLDSGLFEAAAERKWPAAQPVLPRLSRSANHGVLWFATAAAVTASRTPRARRAAARGIASLPGLRRDQHDRQADRALSTGPPWTRSH